VGDIIAEKGESYCGNGRKRQLRYANAMGIMMNDLVSVLFGNSWGFEKKKIIIMFALCWIQQEASGVLFSTFLGTDSV